MVKKFGELLIEENLINSEQLEIAINESERTGEFLGKILIEMKLINEDQMLQILSEQTKIPYIDLSKIQVQDEAVKRVSEKLAWDYSFMPIKLKDDVLIIAIGNPLNVMIFDKLQSTLGLKLELNLAKETDIKELIKKHYIILEDTIAKLLSVEE